MYTLLHSGNSQNVVYVKVKLGVKKTNLKLKDVELIHVDEASYFKSVFHIFEKCLYEKLSETELKNTLIRTCGMSESLAEYYLEKQKVKIGQRSC